MSQRVVIHCGFHKTGSTFIQRALRQSGAILEKHSIHFFSLPNLDQLGLRPSLHRLADKGFERAEFDHLKQTLGRRALEATESNFLLSYEQLLGSPPAGFYRRAGEKLRLLLEVFAPLETTVIAYIKRQDRMLESIYKQRIQMGKTMEVADFLETIDYRNMSWERLLGDIEAVVGRSRLSVRLAEDLSQGEQAQLNEFLSLVVVRPVEETFVVPRQTNQSYSELALKIARVINPILDKEQIPRFRRLLREHFDDGTKPAILGTALRNEILSYHGPGNEAVLARYLRGRDPGLYGESTSPPTADE